MAAAAVSRTLLCSVRDMSPPPSKTVLPCGPRSAELLAAPHPFLIFCPVRPGGVYKNTMVVAAVLDLLPDRLQQPPRPPLGMLPELRRARVRGVSSANHEEVGGIWHLPRAVPVPPYQDLAADTSRRRVMHRDANPMYLYLKIQCYAV